MNLIEGHIVIEPPEGVPVWDVDPYDPEILANPNEYYAELRSKGPFAYIPKYSILACGRYAETREVFADWERFVSSRGVGLLDFKVAEPWRPASIVLEVDPPYHTQNRTVMARALSPRTIAAQQENFKIAAEKLVDELLEKDTFEAVTECAEIYPTRVFPAAVGLKKVDPRILVDYGATVFNSLGPDNEMRRTSLKRVKEMIPWILEQCQRENLTEDGFGSIIYAAADTGEITEEEAAMLVRSLLSAGIDTTVSGIGNTLWCLVTNPHEFERLKADPSLARGTFEEVLRYTTPVHSFCRTANLDTEVSGIKITNGTKILCALGSANLDEEKWENATKFDITRKPIGHLGMGVGIHGCVGQNVARAEVAAVLAAILQKVDKIELIGSPVWRPSNAIHALDKMELKFS